MIGSLYAGISGLNANSSAMSVIGDNIANVNTTAFKANSASFVSVLSQSLTGSTGNTIGRGVKLGGVSESWTQGTLETTGSGTDLAINGKGFFMVNDSAGLTYYTRAGGFNFDLDGNLVNTDGLIVQGYAVATVNTDGTFTLGSIGDITVTGDISPAKASTDISTTLNLDAGATFVDATLTVDCTNANSDVTYTAVNGGITGNDITIVYTATVDLAETGGYVDDQTLSIGVSGDAITVNLATDADGNITSTAAAIVTAVAADTDAAALVTGVADGTGLGVVEVKGCSTVTVDGGAALPTTDDVAYTAVNGGIGGDLITITYAAGALDVSVVGNAITVTLLDGVTTAAAIAAAVNADADAKLLVTAVAEGADVVAAPQGPFSLSGGAVVALSGGAVVADVESTTMTVYDSLGNDIPLTITFTRTTTGDGGLWAAAASIPSSIGSAAIDLSALQFDSNGNLATIGAGTADATITLTLVNGATSGQTINWDLFTSNVTNDTVTGYASPSVTSFQSQDGYAAGTLQGVSVDERGVVTGAYTNGELPPLFQLALVDFPNYQGLDAIGDNLYSESRASGSAAEGTPGNGSLGLISSSSLEMSNVDLATEFVKMITTQRAFQASSRVITTSDEILQELINLKR